MAKIDLFRPKEGYFGRKRLFRPKFLLSVAFGFRPKFQILKPLLRFRPKLFLLTTSRQGNVLLGAGKIWQEQQGTEPAANGMPRRQSEGRRTDELFEAIHPHFRRWWADAGRQARAEDLPLHLLRLRSNPVKTEESEKTQLCNARKPRALRRRLPYLRDSISLLKTCRTFFRGGR